LLLGRQHGTAGQYPARAAGGVVLRRAFDAVPGRAAARADAAALRRPGRDHAAAGHPGPARGLAAGAGARVSRGRPCLQLRGRPAPLPSAQRRARAQAHAGLPGRRVALKEPGMSRHAPDPGPYALDPQLAADSHPLATLELCELRLMDDANYPWLVLVPRLAGARELLELE